MHVSTYAHKHNTLIIKNVGKNDFPTSNVGFSHWRITFGKLKDTSINKYFLHILNEHQRKTPHSKCYIYAKRLN